MAREKACHRRTGKPLAANGRERPPVTGLGFRLAIQPQNPRMNQLVHEPHRSTNWTKYQTTTDGPEYSKTFGPFVQ